MIQPAISQPSTRIAAGKQAYSISSANGVGITVTYGITFTTLVSLQVTVKSDSNVGMIAFPNGAPGLSSAAVFVQFRDAGTTSSQAGDVHWLAIGT